MPKRMLSGVLRGSAPPTWLLRLLDRAVFVFAALAVDPGLGPRALSTKAPNLSRSGQKLSLRMLTCSLALRQLLPLISTEPEATLPVWGGLVVLGSSGAGLGPGPWAL